MEYSELTSNQKRVVNLLYNYTGEYWIQKQYSNNKQGFLWRLHEYDPDLGPYKINNWTVNALIKKGWLKVDTNSIDSIYDIDYAILTEKAKKIISLVRVGIGY